MRVLSQVLVATVCLSATAVAQDQGHAEDIDAFNDALRLILGVPASDTYAEPYVDPELEISLSGQNGVWSLNQVPLDSNRLVLPVDTVIRVKVTSEDLIYSIEFPDLRLQFEAIPGRTTDFYLEFSETGLFAGECTLLCGSAGAPLVFDVREQVAPD